MLQMRMHADIVSRAGDAMNEDAHVMLIVSHLVVERVRIDRTPETEVRGRQEHRERHDLCRSDELCDRYRQPVSQGLR